MKNNILFFLLISCCVLYSQEKQTVDCQFIYDVFSHPNTSKIRLVCLIPNEVQNSQHVMSLQFSRHPNRVFVKDENKYAEFVINQPLLVERIIISTKIQLSSNSLLSSRKTAPFKLIDYNRYLIHEKYLESNNPKIKEVALSLKGKNDVKTIKKIFKYVRNKFEYSFNTKELGALKALSIKSGDCTEYSDLFVALCRANGIPARTIEGYLALTQYKITPRHSWAEVYLQDVGWVKFEPTRGYDANFKKTENNYIQLSNVRNDSVLNNYHFWYYRYWGEKAKVKSSFKVL
ncbi:transglutaminase-like domain-containing protein [Wenyingzhuangia sp. IMCC45467]